jgi:hypothetical protein
VHSSTTSILSEYWITNRVYVQQWQV